MTAGACQGCVYTCIIIMTVQHTDSGTFILSMVTHNVEKETVYYLAKLGGGGGGGGGALMEEIPYIKIPTQKVHSQVCQYNIRITVLFRWSVWFWELLELRSQ